MDFILKISNSAFVTILPENELVITANYTKATKHKTIGEAMKMASRVNGMLGTYLVKAVQL